MRSVYLIHVYLIIDRCPYDRLYLQQVEGGFVITVPGKVDGKLDLHRSAQGLLDDIKDLHQ